MAHSEEHPIGDRLDGLGITAGIDDGELVAAAVVILKVIDPDGGTRLSVSHSEGLGWIERAGMLNVAHAVDLDGTVGRRRPGA